MKKVIALIMSIFMLCSVSVQAYDVECYDTTKRSIGEAADASGMSYEEYQKYMFINEDIPSWETERAAELKSSVMPVINALGVTVDEFKAMFGLAIDITDTTTMCEVYDNMSLETYWGTEYDAMVEHYGIADTVTPETPYGSIRLETEKKDMESVERVTFSDVGYKHWAHYYIDEMMKSEIIDGYDDGTYLPEETVTRAEFAKMLAVITGAESDGENKYTDVEEGIWYLPYVNAVSDYIDAENGKFSPESPATREVVATAITKCLGYSLDASSDLLNEKFTDADTVSENNAVYVAGAVANGVIDGFDDGTIRGKDSLTRAQAATVLYRAFYEQMQVPEAYSYVVAKTGDVELTLGDVLYTVNFDENADLTDQKVLNEQLVKATTTTIKLYRGMDIAKKEGITLTDSDIRECLSYRSQYSMGISYRKYCNYLKTYGTSIEYINKYIDMLIHTQKLIDIYGEEELSKMIETVDVEVYEDVLSKISLSDIAMG